MKRFLITFFALCCFFVTNAQIPAETNILNSKYPLILPDNRIEFRVNAPSATKVQVDLGKRYDMTRDEKGVWSAVTEPQASGIHYYSIIIDGVSVADPSSESFFGCGRMMSCVEVPYDKDDKRFEIRDVQHGDVRTVRYFSKVTNSWRKMYVYTPAGYDDSSEKYPVLYIIHGGGEDARGWIQQGRTDIIMDYLIADKKAVPMLVVSLDANVNGFENARNEILDNVIPFVESRFRVIPSADKRALAGLSMGGMYTLYTGVPNNDKFNYLGVFSSGWFADDSSFMSTSKEKNENYAYMKANAEKINKNIKKFWLSQGGKEDIAFKNCRVMMKNMKDMGVNFEYYQSKAGGHTWPVWREDLDIFAPMLFK